MSSYIIKGNLTEKQIEADVAMYLGWCASGLPVRLIDVDEQATGADKLYDAVIPIYLQFKKSTGLMPYDSRRQRAGALHDIRKYRSDSKLADDPTLYFQLREKAKTALDLQHNILMQHNRPPNTFSSYVAPLHLDRDKYYQELIDGGRYLNLWFMKNITIREKHTLSIFDLQPFLRNHVSIPPHKSVTDHRHYYAYSVTGDEVSWHSPEPVEGGPFRLSDFMSARLRQLSEAERLPTAQDGVEVAISILERLNVTVEQVIEGDNPLKKLRSYGRWLHEEHQIRQLLICATSDELRDIREAAQGR